jgi:RHS repeat-associated protein
VLDKPDATGTYNRRNREYDPQTARWTQEDPAGLAGGLNLYGFAAGDPANFSDPFGLRACCTPEEQQQIARMVVQKTAPAKSLIEGIAILAGLKDLAEGVSDLASGHVVAGTFKIALALPVIPGEEAGVRVAANLRRTLKGAQGADVAVTRVGKWIKATWEVAGEGGGESRAVWTKYINDEGETVKLYKDSYDRAGKFQHRKVKFPN